MLRSIFGRLNPNIVKKILIAVVILMALVAGFVISYLMTSERLKDSYEVKLTDAREVMEVNQRVVYKSINDIPRGSLITKDLVERTNTYSSQLQELYIGADDIGKVALIDIKKDVFITDEMITGESVPSEIREVEYEIIHINSNIVSNDSIDVRINYPNGEDYIILSKKVLKGLSVDVGNCFLWLNEEEILRMASAAVDAYLYTGSKIYTTKYIEENLQEASYVNYKPSLATLQLMKDNPNIVDIAITELSVQVRKALENRLADSLLTDVSTIEWVEGNSKTNSDIEDEEETNIETEEEDPKEENENIKEPIKTYKDQQDEKGVDLDYGP